MEADPKKLLDQASTQNQALSTVLFLDQAVLKLPLDDSINAVCAKCSKFVPIVLSQSEVRAVGQETAGVPQLLLRRSQWQRRSQLTGLVSFFQLAGY
jgi:hypothetical protein